MTQIKLPKLHIGQQQAKQTSKRFTVLCCGRRWGKTAFCTNPAIENVLEGRLVGWFAPDYKTLTEAYRTIEEKVRPVIVSANKSEKRIVLSTGGIIDFWTLQNKDAGRSRRYHLVVADEVAIIPSFLKIWQSAMLPTLADFGGKAIFASTPKGLNDFNALYKLAESSPELWSSYHAPTSQNPYIDSLEIEIMRSTMSDKEFSQEILAEFVNHEGGVFRHITDASVAVRQERAIDGHSYVIGVDTAYTNDFTVIMVVDATTKEAVWYDRFNMLDTTIQVSRIASAVNRFPNSQLVIEQNGAMAVIEMCVASGLTVRPFLTSAQSKPKLIQKLEAGFDRGLLKIISDPILTSELLGYQAKRSASGSITYEGLPHDDTVMALAIAWYHADRVGLRFS